MISPGIDFDGARTYLAEAQCVLFTARRGERTLRCYVTRRTLAARFGVDADPGEPPSEHALRCYDTNRHHIEAAARSLIERHGAPRGALMIDSAGAYFAASDV